METTLAALKAKVGEADFSEALAFVARKVMAEPKTPVEALALALRLGILATTDKQWKQAMHLANRLADGMTAEQLATAKQMAAIV